MKKKILLTLVALVGLASCQNKSIRIDKEYDSNSDLVRKTEYIDSEEYSEIKKIEAVEKTNQEYYKAQAKLYEQVESRDVTSVLAVMGLAPDRSPTTYNDVSIQQSKSSVEKWGIAKDGAVSFFGSGFKALTWYKGLDVVGDLASKGGVEINGDGNEVRGTNTGEDGSASYSNNEPVTNTTTTTTENSSDEGTVDGEIDPTAIACEEANGTYVADEGRCSDGIGGTIEL